MADHPMAPEGEGEPRRDFAKMFDLDRTTAVKNFVDRMEICFRLIAAARDDLKEVVHDANEAEFIKRDIAAMKKIAKLRLDDKGAEAAKQLDALERIGRAVGFDLFDWHDAKPH